MRRKATHCEAPEGGDPEKGSRLAAGPGMGFLSGNENVLEFECGDGCITINVFFKKLLNYTL